MMRPPRRAYPRYLLELEDLTGQQGELVALRIALKRMLRSLRLRCLSVREVSPAAATDASPGPTANGSIRR